MKLQAGHTTMQQQLVATNSKRKMPLWLPARLRGTKPAPSSLEENILKTTIDYTGDNARAIQAQPKVFSHPRNRRRASQPARGYSSEPLFESSRVVRGRRVGERPCGREAQGDVGGSGVSFLLVTFLWTSKEKSPAVGQPPTSMFSYSTIARKRAIPFKDWMPAYAGMTAFLDFRFRGDDNH
jgi:hypothetical protein